MREIKKFSYKITLDMIQSLLQGEMITVINLNDEITLYPPIKGKFLTEEQIDRIRMRGEQDMWKVMEEVQSYKKIDLSNLLPKSNE